ncbi:hypothetical protein [Salinigranum sp. GCM10025319]|uniref:hypothetical protein n=1 Tax=Salinigranum sp. GCM10025319 TaxID=3252687 RepID=UPI003612DBFD
MDDRDERAETTITRMSLRRGGWIGYNDDAVFVRRDDEAGFRIPRADIVRITLNPMEWDLTVMSLLLVGIGVYVGATRNVLVGVGFVAVGCWSLYRTYGKRYELVIRVEDEPKPVSVYPVDPKACHETLGDLIRAPQVEDGGESEAEGTSEVS